MKSRTLIRKPRPVPTKCNFCETKTRPDYKEVALLNKFVTERGKILGRARTGICSKHQKQVTTAIKRARFLAMMPFVVRA